MTHKPQYTAEEHEIPDQWHRHTADEGTPQEEHAARVNSAVLLVLFLAIVAFVAATIGATYLYFETYMVQERQRKIETTVLAKDFWKYRGKAEENLGQPSWVYDGGEWKYREKTGDLAGFGWSESNPGAVSIPVDMAKKRVLDQYGTRKAEAK